MNYIELSQHAREDRSDRLTRLMVEVGLGEVVLECKSAHHKEGRVERLTSTGLVLVFDINKQGKEVLVTGFAASISKATAMYRNNGIHKMPKSIYNRVVKNGALWKR